MVNKVLNKSVIKRVIDVWDPIELFPGCPEDEYSKEIDEIFLLASREDNLSTDKLAGIILSVFRTYFDNCFTKSADECMIIAEKIMNT